jgi:hypothetical protein
MQGRALLGHLTPDFDDVQRVSVFPSNRVEGHTSFVPQESHLESGVLTRGYLESQLVSAVIRLSCLIAHRCSRDRTSMLLPTCRWWRLREGARRSWCSGTNT